MWKKMHYELGPPEDTLLPMDKVDVRISLLDILMKQEGFSWESKTRLKPYSSILGRRSQTDRRCTHFK